MNRTPSNKAAKPKPVPKPAHIPKGAQLSTNAKKYADGMPTNQ